MAANRIEKAGVSFGIRDQGGAITVEVHPNHDTITALRGALVSFELLNGITLAQAKKLLDVMNEKVIGVLVTTTSNDKTNLAPASEVAAKL